MTTADWNEVKRLAADFQKAQLSYTLQKLSERNCIEIIIKLTEKKLLDVVFTNDGKEYVTPQHLTREIKDELYIHGGRISLTELSNILNVDLSQISKLAIDVEKNNKGLKIVLGQLIDKIYISKIAEEINDKLNQHGFVNIVDLTLYYDLPAEFLQSMIEKELGKTILGKQDTEEPRIFYNQDYIARNEAKIRGALSAITKPTQISAVLRQCSVPERIFFSILENLQEKHQVPGIVTGKQSSNSIYVPSVYSKSQNEWVENFYKHNGYLEYEVLSRLGILHPKDFIKRHFSNRNLIHLDKIAINSALIDQVDANIEEAISTGSFTDISSLLPPFYSSEDVKILLKESLLKKKSSVHIFANTFIVSDIYLETLQRMLEPLAEEKAKEAVESGKWLQSIVENKLKLRTIEIPDNKTDRKAERRKKASGGKAGGGNQGRETKTKSVKKKYQQSKNQDFDSDNEQIGLENGKLYCDLVSIDDIKRELNREENLVDIYEFIDEFSSYLHPLLNKHVAKVAEKLLQKNKTINLNEIDDHLNALITNIRVFDKGIKCLDKTAQESMIKYVLKTLVVDFVTEIFKLAAHQNVIQYSPNLTSEARQKMLQDLPKEVKEPLTNLHKVVTGNTLEDFFNNIEPAMSACCLVLRKYDKKKDKFIISAHREALLEQLNNTQDAALALHLTTTILFIAATKNTIHMSGRHVSSILSFLQPYLEQSTVSALTKYHDLVLKFLSSSNEATKKELQKLLEHDLQEIKIIANEYKSQLKVDKFQDS